MPQMPAKSDMTRVIVWTVVAIVVLVGGYVAFAANQQLWPFASEPVVSVSPSPSASATPGSTSSPQADPTAGWKTYTNTQYGFGLTFPDSWKGYSVTKQEITSGKSWRINFNIKDSDGSDYTLFSIGIFTKTEWNRVVQQGGPASRELLNQNTTYAFTASRPQSAPVNPALTELLNTTVTQILSTFKFTDTAPDPTAGWKTYTNTKYGLTLKYPSSFSIIENSNNFFSAKDSSLWLVLHINNPGSGGTEIYNPITKTIAIDGVAVSYRTGRVLEMGSSVPSTERVWIGSSSHGGTSFDFIFTASDGVDRTQLVNQILSTFKFTK